MRRRSISNDFSEIVGSPARGLSRADAKSVLFSIGLFFLAAPAAAHGESFIFKGKIAVLDRPGVVKSISIRNMESGESTVIAVANDFFTGRLDVGTYFYKRTELKFDIDQADPLFTFDPVRQNFSEGPAGLSDGVLVRDFRFYHPAKYAGLLMDRTDQLQSSRNCADFIDASNRYDELLRLDIGKIYEGNLEKGYARLLNSASIVLTKIVRHRCLPEEVADAPTALDTLVSAAQFPAMKAETRTLAGQNIANAINGVDFGDAAMDKTYTVMGRDLLKKVVATFKVAEATESVAAVVFALVALERKANSVPDATAEIEKLFGSGLLDVSTEKKDGAAFQYFLLISGGNRGLAKTRPTNIPD